MSRFIATEVDPARTQDRRLSILTRAPLTARLPPAEIGALLAASALATCASGTTLFTSGDAPRQIFIVGSGTVQMRVATSDAALPALHLCLLGPGDLVADRELACLAAGFPGTAARRYAACVLGAAAEILAIDQAAMASVAARDAGAREWLAATLTSRTDALERLVDELATLKNFGKVRLARLLLQLFDRMGQVRGGVLQIPHPVSHGDIGAMLGLTRRSVADDMLALESFDAIDHDRNLHLALRDRFRLARIAQLYPSAGREDGAAWRVDVEAALAAGDTLRALQLAREARLYHPRDSELGYSAALAALRTGAVEEAEALIEACKFSGADDDERVAALGARVLKERAFASETRERLLRHALQSAQAYAAVHRNTKGRYSALNAASMFYVAGQTASGEAIARALVAGKRPAGADYWSLATRAEAFWLLGETGQAAACLREAVGAADADDGKIATTRRQVRRLSALLGRDAAMLDMVFPVRQTLVCVQPPDDDTLLAHEGWSRAFLAVTAADDLARYAASRKLAPAEFVLAAPAETFLRHAPEAAAKLLERAPCHLADASSGPVTAARRVHAWRRALGLGCLAAAEAGTALAILDRSLHDNDAWPEWAAPDSLSANQGAVLWLQSADETGVADLVTEIAAEKLVSPGEACLRFAGIADALAAARRLRDRTGTRARLCLDVEAASPAGLADATLLQVRPLIASGLVFATEAAAAEIALLHRTDIELIAVGRVRSQRRHTRLNLWAARTPAVCP